MLIHMYVYNHQTQITGSYGLGHELIQEGKQVPSVLPQHVDIMHTHFNLPPLSLNL